LAGESFVTGSEGQIPDHLNGKHVVGVYALLPDDTCHSVA